MRVAARGNLRQVRDAQDLEHRTKCLELAPDYVGDSPSDTGVHLVEYEARGPNAMQPGPRKARLALKPHAKSQRLDREHDPRELAARRDACERPQILAWVGRDEELCRVDPIPCPRGLRDRRIVVSRTSRSPSESNLEPSPFHATREQTLDPRANRPRFSSGASQDYSAAR